MASFKRTLVPDYPRADAQSTPDTVYWRKLGFPVTVKEHGAITHVDFSPVEPYYFAVSNSTRVQVYHPASNQIYRNLTRFHYEAFGGTFRQDGKLVIAGDEEGLVRVFDVATKNVLRFYKGHKGPVHKCTFLPGNTNVASFSDDKTVALWDIPTEKQVHVIQEHKDYVRTGAASHVSSDIFFSGSYDHTVKMYDVRTVSSVMSVDHGSPVEAILIFPSGGLMISAGSVDIKIWDILTGGKLLAKLTQHHKTVTSLCFASENKRIVSASLDCHVKIYDVATYQTVHTMKYPSAILSVGVAADDSTVAVGMVDGLLSIQHRSRPTASSGELGVQESKKTKTSYKFLLEAKAYKAYNDDVIVKMDVKQKLKAYDKYLKSFESTMALDSALNKFQSKVEPAEVVIAVLQELTRRGTLNSALIGRNEDGLKLIIKFIERNIRDIRFMSILVDVTNILLDHYSPQELRCLHLFKAMKSRVKFERNFMKEVSSLNGTMEILLAAANGKKGQKSDSLQLEPSSDAVIENKSSEN